jgi:hypothetical protein
MENYKQKKLKNKNLFKINFINPIDFQEKNTYFYNNAVSILEAGGDDNKYLHLDVLGRITKPKNKEFNRSINLERKALRTLSRQMLEGKGGSDIFTYYGNRHNNLSTNDGFTNTEQSIQKTNNNVKNKLLFNFSPERNALTNSNNSTMFETFKKNKKKIVRTTLPSLDRSNNSNSKSIFVTANNKMKSCFNKTDNNLLYSDRKNNKHLHKTTNSMDFKMNNNRSNLLTSVCNFKLNNLNTNSNLKNSVIKKHNYRLSERSNEKKFVKTCQDIIDERLKKIELFDSSKIAESKDAQYSHPSEQAKYKVVAGLKILTVPKNFHDNLKVKKEREIINNLKDLSKKENLEIDLFFNKLSHNNHIKTKNNFFESFRKSMDFVEKQNIEIKNNLIDIKKIYKDNSYYINPKHLAVIDAKTIN